MERVDTIIYHAACPDGQAAAWAVLQRWPHAYALTCQYRERTLAECVQIARRNGAPGRHIIVVDFSFPRAQVLAALEDPSIKELVILDHHEGAEIELADLPGCIFSWELSGAQMAWDYIHPGQPRPAFIDYVADRDRWVWKLPFSKEISFARMNFENSIAGMDAYGRAIEEDLDSVVATGAAQLLVYNRRISCAAGTAVPCTLFGVSGRMVVADREIRSELGHHMLERYPDAQFALVLAAELSASGVKWRGSLRSTDERADVRILAEKLGGSGHRNASGIALSQDILDSMLAKTH